MNRRGIIDMVLLLAWNLKFLTFYVMDYGSPPPCLAPFTFHKKHRQSIHKHLQESLNILITTQNKMILCYIKQIEQFWDVVIPKHNQISILMNFQREQRHGNIRMKTASLNKSSIQLVSVLLVF